MVSGCSWPSSRKNPIVLRARQSAGFDASFLLKHVMEPPKHVQYVLGFEHEFIEAPFFKVFADNAVVVLKKFMPNHPRHIICHCPRAMNHQVSFVG